MYKSIPIYKGYKKRGEPGHYTLLGYQVCKVIRYDPKYIPMKGGYFKIEDHLDEEETKAQANAFCRTLSEEKHA